jgi:hypothetical protein
MDTSEFCIEIPLKPEKQFHYYVCRYADLRRKVVLQIYIMFRTLGRNIESITRHEVIVFQRNKQGNFF